MDTLIQKRFLQIIKIINFRGELTDISAKKEALAYTPPKKRVLASPHYNRYIHQIKISQHYFIQLEKEITAVYYSCFEQWCRDVGIPTHPCNDDTCQVARFMVAPKYIVRSSRKVLNYIVQENTEKIKVSHNDFITVFKESALPVSTWFVLLWNLCTDASINLPHFFRLRYQNCGFSIAASCYWNDL